MGIDGIDAARTVQGRGFASFVATPRGFVSLTPLLAIGLIAGIRPLLAGSLRAVHTPFADNAGGLAGAGGDLAPLSAFGIVNRAGCLHRGLQLVPIGRHAAADAGHPSPPSAVRPAGRRCSAPSTCILAYWLALCWFMLWRGLDIGRGKAALAVLAINLGTGLLVLLPQWLAEGLR
jgi:hypothetical protein